CQQNNEEPFTF
nr:immunoglobulin light chain junction region [Mus musculus]